MISQKMLEDELREFENERIKETIKDLEYNEKQLYIRGYTDAIIYLDKLKETKDL
tara:strand:+ start:660 stop:824 length:165 start_codon:yes stop_codon:yes gene_type:complete